MIDADEGHPPRQRKRFCCAYPYEERADESRPDGGRHGVDAERTVGFVKAASASS